MSETQYQVQPVGYRPKCLQCGKELRPNFKWKPVPYSLFGNDVARGIWKKQNPREFLGTYGSYHDNRFCGLRHGYEWAVGHTTSPLGGRRIKP